MVVVVVVVVVVVLVAQLVPKDDSMCMCWLPHGDEIRDEMLPPWRQQGRIVEI